MKQIVIIGGGAAGIFGAIACAEANPNVRITVLEAGSQPLSKVKISGGGRCNVTHACFDPDELITHYPRGYRALKGPFRQFQPQDTVNWFTQRGVTLKTEADGRMFPVTDRSQTIIDCLLHTAAHHRIQIRTRCPVSAVQQSRSAVQSKALAEQPVADHGHRPFQITLKSGEQLESDRLLLATGSHATGYRIAQSLGHRLNAPVPSLFTFTIKEPELTDLAGVAINPIRASVAVPGQKTLEQYGPLLITHWGMSGPAILKLSAWGARLLHTCRYQAPLRINWVPDQGQDPLRQRLLAAKTEWSRKAIATVSPIPLPRRLWRYLLTRANIDPQSRWADLSKKRLNHLLQTLVRDDYAIHGKGVFKDEFVTCGGIVLNEINFKTMASRPCPGLFLAGELLDIDGVTGGFNFQNAWTTGWLAGQAMASD